MQPQDAFRAYFTAQEYNYAQVENGFKLDFANTPCPITQLVFFNFIEPLGQVRVQFITLPEWRIPRESYWEVLDLVNRVNASTAYVTWSLDPRNGVLRSVSVCFTDPQSFSSGMAEAMDRMTSMTVDELMSAVSAVIHGGESGAQAFDRLPVVD